MALFPYVLVIAVFTFSWLSSPGTMLLQSTVLAWMLP